MIAIDFETYLISNEHPYPKPICLSVYDGNKEALLIGDKIPTFLKSLLESNVTVIAHNAVFEMLVITRWYPELTNLVHLKYSRNQVWCTKIYEQLIDYTRKRQLKKYGLDSLVKHYFHLDISETKKNPHAWRLRYSELDGIPLEEWPIEAKQYAIDDSVYAFKIQKRQACNRIDASSSIEADYYLNYMGQLGISIDLDRTLQLESEMTDALAPAYALLVEKGFATLNKKGKYSKSIKGLQAYTKELGINLEYTAKGAVSVKKESLDRYVEQSHNEILQAFINITDYEKILTAFITHLKNSQGLIRTQYNPAVSTGRTSSYQSKVYPSVNIQQMPREVKGVTWDVRNCFVPRPGKVICSIDYSGLELTSAAHQLYTLTGQSNMRDAINFGDKPADMHSRLAARLMTLKTGQPCTYEHFVANKKNPEFKFYRQLAKPINLGFPGGIGYDTMRSLLLKDGISPSIQVVEKSWNEDSLMIPMMTRRNQGQPARIKRHSFNEYHLVLDELVAFKQELFGLYPDLEYFLKEGHKEYLNGGTIKTKNEYGEVELEETYSYEIAGFRKDWCLYTQVCNGLLMQSPSAVGAKRAAVAAIKKYFKSDNVNILAFIHDEILFEVDRNYMERTIEDISEIMIDKMQEVFYTVRVSVEAEASEYWRKSGGFYTKSFWKDKVR